MADVTAFGRRRWSLLTVAAVVVGGVVAVAAASAGAAWIYFHPRFEWTRGVVYGERHGEPLVLDIVRPARPNGLGIVLVVSGGWRSGAGSFRPWLVAPVLRRGYTVFPVYHVSQPKASVAEIFEDVSRGVRFVRAHAADYGIDPDRIGVTGGSAGGHLSLLLATRGGPGPDDAADPVDRASSAVQSVAIFYPVTDLTNLRGSTEDTGDGGPPKSFLAAFRQEPIDMDAWRTTAAALSPVLHVSPDLPPTLIHHGDADTLVPLDQSERFARRAEEEGARVVLRTVAGGSHGWLLMPLDIMAFAAWFDATLEPGRAGRLAPAIP